MGLFTNPVTLTDGVDVTRIFSFRAQRADSKSVVGDYIEEGPAIAEESLLVVKHDSRNTPRHLLQRSTKRRPAANAADTPLLPITINVTITADAAFTPAEIQTELNITIDACQEANFVSGMLSGKL